MTKTLIRMVLSSAFVCFTASVTVAEQATTTTTETKKFQIIAVDGNRLVVALPEGTRELTVADDFQFNVDGKMLSVQQLKPGMSGTATITTKTTQTPVTVTEVKNGTVVHSSGGTIIVRTDEGFKKFTQGDVDKRGVKIMRSGKPAQVSDFRENDRLSATIITSMPPQIVTEQEVQATLAKAPRTAAAGSASGTASGTAAGSGGAAGAAPRTLPKTASPLPLVGLVGLASLLTGLALTARRRRAR